MKTTPRILLALVALAAASSTAHISAAEPRVLDRENAERKEVRYSMVGPRNTLLFYTYPEQRVVLRLEFNKKGDKFPVSGKVFVFDPAVTAEGLGKWLNNQHSDGLFPEVPEPTQVVDLDDDDISVTGKKFLGEKTSPTPRQQNRRFLDFLLTFKIEQVDITEDIKLLEFKDEVGLFVEPE